MLNKIEISGYKSIKKLELEMKPINVLIGSNGVGKTNFISFFKLVNTIYEQRLQEYSLKTGADNVFYYGRKQTEKIEGYLQFSDNAYKFILNSKDNGQLFIESEESLYKNRPIVSKNLAESSIKDSFVFRDEWLREYLESYKIYHFHDTSINSPLRTDSNVNDNRMLKENGNNIAAFLYFIQQKHPKDFVRIQKTIQSVAPYFERFDLRPDSFDETQISLVWNEKGHPEKYFDATHLSDGSLRFIAIATLFLQPKLPNIIIIDEPELGLHPVAIEVLAGLMQSAADRGCQIIASTQSASLLDHFSAHDIITVDRIGDDSIFNRLCENELENWLNSYSVGELWTKSVIQGQPK